MERSDSSAGQVPSQPSAQGLTVLMSPENAALDIVFVHGFTGHPQRTWTHKGEIITGDRREADSEGSEHPSKYRRLLAPSQFKRHETRKPVYWPRDLVPVTLPNARVLTYGYDTNIRHKFDAPISKATVYDIGKDLLVSLDAERRSEPSRPLIFVAHSLGGIVVKEAIRRSHSFQMHQTHLHNIFKSAVAVIFFGTPHSGADPRSLIHLIAEKVILAAGFSVNEQIVNTLLPTSERLRELRDEFSPMAHQEGWIIYSFQEQYGVPALGNKKVVEDVSSILSDSTIEITQHIASNHMEMCRFKGLEDIEYKKVAAALVRISNATVPSGMNSASELPFRKPSDLNQENTQEQQKSYLDALAFPQIDARLLNIKKAHDRTCMWLLEQSEYQDWLDPKKIHDHHGFLWVKGKPGAGKSTMMKYALVRAKQEMASSVIISFFFNARGEALEKSTLGMYRSLLFQLLTAIPDLQKVFIPVVSAKQKDGEVCEWNIEELKAILASAIENLGRQHLTCFIDALDECQEDQVRDMVEFLEHLGQLAVLSGIRLNIYLSSRHYPYIGIEKGIELIIEGQEGHDQDIAKYVSSKLKAGHSKKIDSVKAEILSRASGVFLWVVLVVQMLNKAYDHGQIYALQKRLKEIPNELDDLFADILTRDGENREELVLCLQWILYAQKPLKRPELYFAMMSRIEPTELTEWDPDEITIQDMEKFILSCSKGLAEVTKAKDQTVQFIHESVRDFLLQRNGLSKLQSDLGDNITGLSHDELKQCCQRYIMIDLSQRLPLETPLPPASSKEAKRLRMLASEKFPFLKYAVENMLHHANAAERCGVSQAAFLERFSRERESGFQAWIVLDNLLQRYEIRRHTLEVSLLYILAEKNLCSFIPFQLEMNPNIDIPGERYGFPLYAALLSGSDQAFRVLLGANATTSANSDDCLKNHFTAKLRDREEAIQLLFQERDDMKSNGNRSHNLLSHTDLGGYNGLVELVLGTGKADLNFEDLNRQTLLSKAAWRGHEAIVRLLLAVNEVEIDTADCWGETPLFKAAERGHEAIVRLLLATGKVDVNSKDTADQTPLSMGAKQGHAASVKLLLATDKINVNPRNIWGGTPLSDATNRGHEAIVKLLLATNEVDIDTKDNNSMTPLLLAVLGKHEAILRLLLATGKADVNSRDKRGWTALSWAIDIDNRAMVKLLMDIDTVDVNSRDDAGGTPLSIAARLGCEAFVRLLLATGKVDVNARDNGGRKPLFWAIENGHTGVAWLLENYV